ncbi:Thaumatin-like protein [Camellia lanceoleosa]|uniref:Thaumatin-like protein n=1 Tax=Camellia lanceoleosa TaxID=1840588 RepID=A0ACC0HZR8_9ERIC|nr:Thaumatin-like protein [Camellia lanceoleosa]
MKMPKSFAASFLLLIWRFISSGDSVAQAYTIYATNTCPFPIWPATAPNKGQPVIADGSFYLPPGQTKTFQAPGTWSGRIWARTGCDFTSNLKPACESGDCDGQLHCNGKIGLPPATLVEMSIQVDKTKPSFFDVSLVDGYNLPISVSTNPMATKCRIRGCSKDMKRMCPQELQVLSKDGEVVACKSPCLAFDADEFCCRNEFESPEKCRPSVYSTIFKDVCPDYFSYPFDTPTPLVNCTSDEHVITFCPSNWGSGVARICRAEFKTIASCMVSLLLSTSLW